MRQPIRSTITDESTRTHTNVMKKFIFIVVSLYAFSGCSSIPMDAFLLMPSNPEDRQLESRIFATKNGHDLLTDSASILNNMGYTTDLLNADVGLLTATQHKSEGGLGSTVVSILSAGLASKDKEQVFKDTFTAMPSHGRNDAFITRLTLQRLVFNSDGKATSVELITDKATFKLFYERLEAATFIEPDQI